MFYYVYKITNSKNGKYYFGAHSTENLNDGYLGSGTYISKAIKKYGKENFSKEILKFFSSLEEMFAFEDSLITEEIIKDEQSYNLSSGGRGGSIRQNRKPFTKKHSDETKKKISFKNKGRKFDENFSARLKETSWARTRPDEQRCHAVNAGKISAEKRKSSPNSEEIKKQISNSLKKYFRENISPILGKPKLKIQCPHCKREIAVNTAKRWHFDKCKFKVVVV